MGTHNKHLSVLDYEKQERTKEVAELDRQIESSQTMLFEAAQLVDSRLERAGELADMGERLQKKNDELRSEHMELEMAKEEAKQSHTRLSQQNQSLQVENEVLEDERLRLKSGNRELEQQQQRLQKELEAMAASKTSLERNVRAYDEDREWQLPEPGTFTSAKSYHENTAKPLVARLKERVKSLTIKCINLMEQVRKLTEKVTQLTSDIDWYKRRIKQQAESAEKLQEKADDLERVKRYAGEEKVQSIIDSMKEMERLDRERKWLQKNYNRGMSR
jgi:chromosome segregation ATPase